MKPVLFIDFDGVLSYQKFWFSLADSKNDYHKYHQAVSDLVFQQNKQMVNDWLTGKCTSEGINQFVANELNLDYEKLFSIFCNDCSNFRVSENLLNTILGLKNKYYTVCRTDNMDCFDRFILPANPLMEDAFNEIDNSYNLKELKNLSYYKAKADRLGVSLKDCVLIDDSQNVTEFFKQSKAKAIKVSGEEKVLETLNAL